MTIQKEVLPARSYLLELVAVASAIASLSMLITSMVLS